MYSHNSLLHRDIFSFCSTFFRIIMFFFSHCTIQQSLSTRPSSRDVFPHTPTPSPEEVDFFRPQNLNRFLLDHAKEFGGDHDDLDSLRSYGSNCSTQSACDHAQFARNGTTFSGKRMKYIVHCSSHPEPNEYLTPTQRANQQLRRLKVRFIVLSNFRFHFLHYTAKTYSIYLSKLLDLYV